MNTSGLVCLGRIVGAHGIKGDVRIESFCADPASLASYGPLVTGSGCRKLDLGIRKSVGSRLVATIAGVNTREQAESLKDAFLYAERNRFPEPETEEHYVADLIGLKAVDTSMHGLGIVVAVQNYGAGDILEVEKPSSNETILLPFTKDTVLSIDHGAGRIVIDPPEGII